MDKSEFHFTPASTTGAYHVQHPKRSCTSAGQLTLPSFLLSIFTEFLKEQALWTTKIRKQMLDDIFRFLSLVLPTKSYCICGKQVAQSMGY